MGATLRYAKVVDRDHLQAHGGLSPATDNLVLLPDAPPAVARDFLVLRAWDDVDTAVEEDWRIEDRHGRTIHTGVPRTVLAEHGDLVDDLAGVQFEYTDTAYQLVLSVDGREVARTDFTVAQADDPGVDAPPASATDTEAPPAAQPAVSTTGTAQAQPDEAVTRELSDTERRALEAVTRLEADGTPGFASDVADRAGLDLDAARAALSGLTGHHDLVQEVPTGASDDPDLGPRYRVKSRP